MPAPTPGVPPLRASYPNQIQSAAPSRQFTGLVDRWTVIMNNAGIMALPERQVKHGIELQF